MKKICVVLTVLVFIMNTCFVVDAVSIYKNESIESEQIDSFVLYNDDVTFVSEETPDVISVDIPWRNAYSDLLEWWIRIEYNSEVFDTTDN